MPDAVEASHMGHPDFRVGKKIFATLGWPDAGFAMVKLTSEQQTMLVEAEPKMFAPVPGGWGRSGSTNVRLAAVDATTLKSAIAMAWQNIAPRSAKRASNKRTANVSVLFDLVDEGPRTNIAREKDKMVGEAVRKEHRRKIAARRRGVGR